jgi:hypothetical protein
MSKDVTESIRRDHPNYNSQCLICYSHDSRMNISPESVPTCGSTCDNIRKHVIYRSDTSSAQALRSKLNIIRPKMMLTKHV